MNRYIQRLKAFLDVQTPNFGYEDANSILEMLYYYYMDTNPVDSASIRCQFKDLDDVLSKLSWVDSERMFSRTVGLCVSHARQAFLEGVNVGVRLFSELDDNDD